MINCIESLSKNIEMEIAEEAVKLANDYPELTAKEALEKAKEIYGYEKD